MAKWIALIGSLLLIAVAAITWAVTRSGTPPVSSPPTTGSTTPTTPAPPSASHTAARTQPSSTTPSSGGASTTSNPQPPATTPASPGATTTTSAQPPATTPASPGATTTASAQPPATTTASPGAAAGTVTAPQTTTQAAQSSITWHITGTYTTRRIDNAYGVASVAHGIFLVVNVVASNATAQSIPLDGDYVDLQLAGARYPLEAAAISALELAGHRTLPPTLAAGATATGSLVFDVPPSAVGSTPQLCLGPTLGATSGAAGCTA